MRTLNRAFLAASAAACALAPALAFAQTADLAAPLSVPDIRHALTRTSFGASPADLSTLVGQSRATLIDGLMDDLNAADTQPAPAFTQHWRLPMEMLYAKNETLGELAIGNNYINVEELSTWWLVETLNTDSPFKEQMTLFWMDHFVTSFETHEDALLTAQKFQSVRDGLAGSFKEMLAAQLRDPALLLYLNNVENTAEAPNENLGRELLELFTLGQDRGYTEADIREISRALTGASVNEADYSFEFYEEDHDAGQKTVFGKQGRFSADDLPDLILSHADFGPYIVEKMWAYFISDTPDAARVAEITAQWKASDWDLPTLYRGILSSDAFWDTSNHGTLVKSPFELYVGFNRTFGTNPFYAYELSESIMDGGQMPFFPPNVAGWNEGPAWITDSSLAQRTATLKEMGEIWAFETFEPADAPAPKDSAMVAETDGLRIGMSALDWAWTEAEDGWTDTGFSLSLYDVGFKGETFRTLTFYVGLGEGEGEREPYFAIDGYGCSAGCPLTALLDRVTPEEDEDGETYMEAWVAPFENSDGVGDLRPDERDFIAALLKAVPALLADAKDDQTWVYIREDAREEGIDVPSFKDVRRTAKALLKAFEAEGSLSQALKTAPALERGTSTYGAVGLPPELLAKATTMNGGSILDEEQADDLYERLYEERTAPYEARLTETFADPDQWFNALPTQAQTSAGLELVLLPLRNPALATDDRAVEGLEDLLFSLILDPRFQLK